MILPRRKFLHLRAIWCLVFVTASCCFAGSPALGQDWARKMFTEHEHDFGVVAKGTEASFRFEFKNLYKEDIHVQSVRSSCGCAIASIENKLLKTGDVSAILVDFNSRVAGGQKKATLTVVIDQPFYAEVQLIIHGNIRANTVFDPGKIQFGEIRQGSKSNQTIRITHHGNTNWRITDVRSEQFNNEQIRVGLKETQRNRGIVRYEMTVELQGTLPPGYVQSELNLISNEGGGIRYPIMIHANVAAPLQLSPSVLSLGTLHPGQQVTHKVILKGDHPFNVTGVTTTDGTMQVEFDQQRTNRLQILNVTYTAGDAAGSHECEATVTTSDGANATFKAVANVE